MEIYLIGIIVLLSLVGMGFWIWFLVSRSSSSPTSGIDLSDLCVPADQLIDISTLQCCVQGGTTTSLRYVLELDSLVGPSAVFWATACEGHCQIGRLPDNSGCIPSGETSGGSEAYQACVNLIKPESGSRCQLALPVAINGIEPFYIVETSDSNCKQLINCRAN